MGLNRREGRGRVRRSLSMLIAAPRRGERAEYCTRRPSCRPARAASSSLTRRDVRHRLGRTCTTSRRCSSTSSGSTFGFNQPGLDGDAEGRRHDRPRRLRRPGSHGEHRARRVVGRRLRRGPGSAVPARGLPPRDQGTAERADRQAARSTTTASSRRDFYTRVRARWRCSASLPTAVARALRRLPRRHQRLDRARQCRSARSARGVHRHRDAPRALDDRRHASRSASSSPGRSRPTRPGRLELSQPARRSSSAARPGRWTRWCRCAASRASSRRSRAREGRFPSQPGRTRKQHAQAPQALAGASRPPCRSPRAARAARAVRHDAAARTWLASDASGGSYMFAVRGPRRPRVPLQRPAARLRRAREAVVELELHAPGLDVRGDDRAGRSRHRRRLQRHDVAWGVTTGAVRHRRPLRRAARPRPAGAVPLPGRGRANMDCRDEVFEYDSPPSRPAGPAGPRSPAQQTVRICRTVHGPVAVARRRRRLRAPLRRSGMRELETLEALAEVNAATTSATSTRRALR